MSFGNRPLTAGAATWLSSAGRPALASLGARDRDWSLRVSLGGDLPNSVIL